MPGVMGLIAYIVAYDVYARLRRCHTISTACWTIQRTPLRRALFFAFWAGLTRHLWGPRRRAV